MKLKDLNAGGQYLDRNNKRFKFFGISSAGLGVAEYVGGPVIGVVSDDMGPFKYALLNKTGWVNIFRRHEGGYFTGMQIFTLGSEAEESAKNESPDSGYVGRAFVYWDEPRTD